ncbi:LysR family transcriptional regulator [Ottowia thiooxydans]|uniref:LysR family transcriptional regulator n=1 Tax=Ottowia thiooxydans TaxID=219182 RepID=UPI0003FA12EE|nr:LysR family transcriptional regulator [Ottowia thiooxydans]
MLALRHIRTLSAVARAGGVRSSSESLRRAPSAVSRAVALLESALGMPLFERKGRGMLPTPAGALVLARFERVQDELSAVLEEAAGGAKAQALPDSAADVLYDERRLRAASLLAELHHMPSVGRQLGVSPSAVSSVLARLEGALRQKLFLRTASGLIPTDAGTRWTLHFDRALAELRYLEDEIAAARGSLRGLITVGTLPLARTRVLPRAIDALRLAHPGLRIHSLESPYEELHAGLMRGKVDFIIGALRPAADPSLSSETLFEDELGVMAAATHPLARKRKLDFSDLRDQSWVLSRPGTPLRASLDQFFVSHGEPALVPAVETGDLALVRGMLMEGGMLTVLSTHQLRYEVDSGHVRVLPFPMDGLRRHIGLVTRAGAQLPPGTLALMGEIRSSSP